PPCSSERASGHARRGEVARLVAVGAQGSLTPIHEEAVMRRGLTVAFAVLALLGVLAPPVFAQAPAPKVTIEGFIDQTTTAEQNMSIYDTDVTRSKDSEWHGRDGGR